MPNRRTLHRLLVRLRRIVRNDQLVLVMLALVIGVAAGLGAIAFRYGIQAVQYLAYGFGAEQVATLAAQLPWWQRVLVPMLGGVVVGLVVHLFLPGRRPQGVAQVIEASALRGGRISLRTGIAAAVASFTSLGVGASVGREGPVVHLGASIGASMARRLRLSVPLTRTLLGCGVASAVAASFNAPIAGVFFALEVVIGHYGLSAFAPIVIASVTGTIISRVHYGDFPAFILPDYELVSFWEFPAFALLGLISGAVAYVFMRSIFLAEDVAAWLGPRLHLPRWLWPAAGGLLVGVIAVPFPHVLGVGYEATNAALHARLSLDMLAALIVAKTAATAISLGSGFSGGVFSPSLYVGAMTGGTFGVLATLAFPELSSGYGVYSIVGMGAVAGAVLGAPISTILIVFEMTGDYEVTIAVMIGVVMASVLVTETVGRSFFLWQLERRGISLEGGREMGLLAAVRVADVMRRHYETIAPDASLDQVAARLRTAPYGQLLVLDAQGRLAGVIAITDLAAATLDGRDGAQAADIARPDPPMLEAGEDLRAAMRLMDAAGEGHVPVVESRQSRRVVGILDEHDVALAYHRTLLQARAEERGERLRPRRRRS